MIDVRSPHYDTVKPLLNELYSLPNGNSSDRRRELIRELAKYSISEQEMINIRQEVIASLGEKSGRELKSALSEALRLFGNGNGSETHSSTT